MSLILVLLFLNIRTYHILIMILIEFFLLFDHFFLNRDTLWSLRCYLILFVSVFWQKI